MKVADVLQFVQHLGLSHSPVPNAPTNILVQCPFAPFVLEHRSTIDRSPSLSIKVTPGASPYHCFGCGRSGSDVYSLVAELEVLGFEDKAGLQAAAQLALDAFNTLDPLRDDYEGAVSVHADIPTGFSRPASLVVYAEVDYERDFAHNSVDAFAYMTARGFMPSAAVRFGFAFDSKHRRVTIPVRWRDGALVGLIGRAVDPDAAPKYYNYWRFPKSLILFGEVFLQALAQFVVVVEGPLDALRLMQCGVDAVATLGTSVSDHQIAKLMELQRIVILFFDADAPGDKARAAVADKLRRRGVDVRCLRPDGGRKDAADYSDVELVALFAEYETHTRRAVNLPAFWQ